MSLISTLPAAQIPALLSPENSENLGLQFARQLGTPVAMWSAKLAYLGPADNRSDVHHTVAVQNALQQWVASKPSEPACIHRAGRVALYGVPLRHVRKTWYFTCAFLMDGSDYFADSDHEWLGYDDETYYEWERDQEAWSQRQLDRLVNAVHGTVASQSQIASLDAEVQALSDQLNSTYEEISLLYGVSQNLHISRSDEELANHAANWLLDCIPAESIVIRLLPLAEDSEVTYETRTLPRFITQGKEVLSEQQFSQLIEELDLHPGARPFVANTIRTSDPTWKYPVRQVIVAPLYESDRLFGWIGALNHREELEFGTTEASLLRSLGAILGIHSGNLELYRQQAEFLASVVRALTSAIDAKDPYTCGHSDRVARIAVRLAKQLGCDQEMLARIYMAGLLHDIGKIGISDEVLLKPGSLTEEEFDHIKEHPDLGYMILKDIRQLSDVLPAVLHHHEEWDGSGYPHGLAGSQIPFIARILAVADAYDAMTSDRPYRSGMPDERVHQIFRAGSAKQWDATVISAFFEAAEDIRSIADCEREDLTLDVTKWT